MTATTIQAQEPRSEKAAMAVTASEKRAIRAVAALRETDESNLLRSTLLEDIVTEYRRAQGITGEAA